MLYTTEMNGKNTMWEVDGSMVPAEWYDPNFDIIITLCSWYSPILLLGLVATCEVYVVLV